MSDPYGAPLKPLVAPRRAPEPAPEPVYLASQLASMCDVDLKTIHNWCARNGSEEEAAELESFRTQGGHLRFRHASVLRFLRRWGYPIPDALLSDRPHVLMVESDPASRRAVVEQLGLRRLGDEYDSVPGEDTTGMWCTARYYLQLWEDPYTALIALGERVGAGAAPDMLVVPAPLAGLDERSWIRVARDVLGDDGIRCVLLCPDERPPTAAREPGVVSLVPRDRLDELGVVLQQQSNLLLGLASKAPTRGRRPRRRRVPIAPREPIFVASQVATIWGVDLKTVHNWVDRGDIEAFRTPGRHLRFRRRALLHLLRRYDKAIPEGLAPARPRAMFVAPEGSALASIAQSFAPRFDVTVQHDPVRALADVGLGCSGANLLDVVVVEFPREGVDDTRWVAALGRHPDTRYTRLVVVGGDEARQGAWHAAGATATMPSMQPELIEPLLSRALGVRPAD
jgi:excisionase family DNA binding protein